MLEMSPRFSLKGRSSTSFSQLKSVTLVLEQGPNVWQDSCWLLLIAPDLVHCEPLSWKP